MIPPGAEAHRAAESAARKSYGKLVAYLAARTRDLASAEDALADAFASALGNWPVSGVPANPEAWLMTAAKRKLIDGARRRRRAEKAADGLVLHTEELISAMEETEGIGDERLRLMFACAHPAIDPAVRAPLILQTILGFDAATIASAFLVAPATMSQRLVRAKTKICEAGIPFRVPERAELMGRLEAVLDAVYAVFTEGWADPAGTETRRRELSGEAIWLGRLVVSLLPEEPETLGLLALMLHAEARKQARRDKAGRYVPLAEQDPANWDERLIEEAECLLFQAGKLAAPARFQIEAAIQSAHAIRRQGGPADWPAIVRLYDGLLALTGSPVVEINRAVALAEVAGAAAGLAALNDLAANARLQDYQPYWAALAELLARTDAIDDAWQAYQRAIGLESDPAVREFLQERQARLSSRTTPGRPPR